ncbi:MAG: hypothetical protein KAU31_09405, partial [Spirochaetaceae bacterium]|nr:hypothetical protein [Spirochaetaceae bacterium]
DDSNAANDRLAVGPFTINDPPDYVVTVPAFPVISYGGHPSEPASTASSDHGGSPTHQIRIEEIDSNDGLQDITWKIYQSDDPFLDGLDVQAASGTIPRLLGGTWAVVDVDFALPGTWGYWYYIVTISAGDDADISNNSLTVGPVPVWEISGNTEFDTDEDDIYISQAEDFAVLLNPGDNVFFNGLIDLDTMRDSFIARTGPSTTEFQIRATWVSSPPKDNLALQVFDETGAFVDQSNEAGNNMEPDGGGYWTLSGLTPDSFYYVDTIATAPGGDVGDDYTIEIIAGP